MRTASASPRAVVAMPTTMAVRIKTWGKGLEYCCIPSAKMGAVPPFDLRHADIKDKNGCLENSQAHDFFNQVAMGDNDVKPNHHQHNHNPVIIESHYHDSLFSLFCWSRCYDLQS